MDAINIILEFDSDKREEIEKDIYSPEREFVDFNILLPCPQELLEQVSGSPENAGVDLVKKYNMTFDMTSSTVRDDIRAFLDEYKKEEHFLTRDVFVEDPQNMESVINSVIAYQKYGFANWYEFNYDKWGVSQNAFHFGKKRRTNSGGFYFVTGGGIPVKWLLALSKKWPDVVFKVYSRMEFLDRGGFVSVYHFKNNEYIRVPDEKRNF